MPARRIVQPLAAALLLVSTTSLLFHAQTQEAAPSGPASSAIEYKNTQYDFCFSVPASWKNYSIVTDQWTGANPNDPHPEKSNRQGPIISIRHPQWSKENPRQDIPIMVFTRKQWEALLRDEFHIGAAPIGPSELGRNHKYVFALPARFDYAFPNRIRRSRADRQEQPASGAMQGKVTPQPLDLKIVQVGELVLRQAARSLSAEEIRTREIRELIDTMKEAMRAAPGVGLAAPQVGHSLQLAVIEDRPEYTKDASQEVLKERERAPVPFHVIINPKLTLLGEPSVEFYEGCLSLPGFMAIVARARRVRVEFLDENAKPRVIEASGWYARILQHEIDHLRGTLYVDRMHPRTLTTVDNYNRYWREKSIAEAKATLAAGAF